MRPVCRFPGQAQRPSDSRYLMFYGNWIEDVGIIIIIIIIINIVFSSFSNASQYNSAENK